MNRRRFIKLGSMAAAAALFPLPLFAKENGLLLPTRRLSFFHVRTHEDLEITYYMDGAYSEDALMAINYILRDHRIDEIKPIDPRLLDILWTISTKLKSSSPIQVISGYRSPATNAALQKRKPNVARKSFHIEGKAVDLHLPGYDVDTVRQAALDLKAGGVGYYPGSRFLHIDSGPVRAWSRPASHARSGAKEEGQS